MVWGVFVKNMVYQSQYPLEKYHTMFSSLDNLVHRTTYYLVVKVKGLWSMKFLR